MTKRINAYYDGSNFYHNAKQSYGMTDIDFFHFSNKLINHQKEKISRILYYNSPVNQQEDPNEYAKQQKFFQRLRETPLVEVNLGKLVTRKLRNIHINCSSCGHQLAEQISCPS